jgi:hypothetical protein
MNFHLFYPLLEKKSLLNETNFGMKNFKTETVPKNKQKSQENEDEQLEELHQIWR